MAYGNALAGLGTGAMRGLELARRHDREDEDVLRQRERDDMLKAQEGRQIERFGLDMDRSRADMAHNEQVRPLQVEAMETQRDRGESSWQRQQLMNERADKTYSRQEQERAQQEWMADGKLALYGAENGDLQGINAWLATNPTGEQAMFEPTEDGYRMLYAPDPGSEDLLERPVARDELAKVVRIIAGMEQPAAMEGKTVAKGAALVDPATGREMYRNNGTGGVGGLYIGGRETPSSVLSHFRQTADRIHGKFDPESNSFIVNPESARNYAEGMQRAQELYALGLSETEAVNIGNFSVLDGMDETQARQMAIDEAESADYPMFNGGKKAEFIRQRTSEIIEEANVARQRYNELTSGAQANDPAQPSGLTLTQPSAAPTAPPMPDVMPPGGAGMAMPDGSMSGRVDRGQPPMRQAPPEDEEEVRRNPSLLKDFVDYYGYRPEGL